MTITPLAALKDNYIWMLIDEQQQQAVCVDPGDAQPVIDFLQNNALSLSAILLTHHHFDHIDGVGKLLEFSPNIPVYAPDDYRIARRNVTVNENTPVKVLNYQFDVLAIPGHTSSHICYYEPNHHLLFCGDTLFSAGCGRVFDGTIEALYQSLKKLRELPDDTKIYCAHEYTRQNLRFALLVEPDNIDVQHYLQQLNAHPHTCSLPSTMGFEKLINPFLRINEPEIIRWVENFTDAQHDSLSIFSHLREKKNHFI